MANREFGGKIRSKRSHNLSKPYEKRKSFLNKFTDTVKDILVPSWLSDFMKGKSTENTQNNLVEEQNGNEVEENEENDNYLTPQDSPTVADRRPAQPRPLHPEFSSYHQPQTKSICRRPNLPNFGNDHLLPSHKVQYPPDPRFSTPTNSSLANDVLMPHTENSEAFSSPLLEKRTYLHLSEADVDQLRNRLHPTNDTNSTASTHLQQQATDDNELDEEEASGSVSVEPEDVPDLDRSEIWNSSYLRGKTNGRGSQGKRPSFEPSLFGSPFMKSSLLSDSLHESPFYAGKTRYGGAAANRKLRLKISNPYSAAMPYRKQVNAKPLKSSSSAVTSSTAKRILDTLEMMATPLSDAHRIPVPNNTFTDSVLQFTPSSLKRRNRPTVAASMFSANSQKLPSRGPPSVMSNSPSIATIARNRQPLQRSFHSEPKKLPEQTKAVESTMDRERSDKPLQKLVGDIAPKTKTLEPTVRELTPEPAAAREPNPEITSIYKPDLARKSLSAVSAAAASFEKSVESPLSFGSSIGGKMKRDKSYSLRASSGTRGNNNVEEEEPPVQLETKFILPVKEMPKFSFNAATTKSSETTPVPRAHSHLNASSITSTPVTSAAQSSQELFTFSSPIPNKAPPISQSSASSLDFKFSSPAKVKEPDTAVQTFQFSTSTSTLPKPKIPTTTSTGITVAPQLKSGSVLEALSGGKTSSPSASSNNNLSPGFLTAKTLKTSGSVMDVLGGANKSSTTSPFSSNTSSVFAGLQPATTLKTGSVMDILGKKTENAPTVTTASASPPSKLDPFMAKFVKPAGTWECDTCMIQNKPEAIKCIACETPKPAPAPKPPKLSSSVSKPDELMAKFLKPAGAWECDTCMVQNKAESLKCCACETLKPGQSTVPPSAAATAVSQKVDPLMAKFLKPAGSWECSVCMIQNKSSDRKCVACQTPNPNAPPEPTGSADVLPKFGAGVIGSSLSFKFGNPSDSSASVTTSTGSFKFGSSVTTSESTEKFKFGTSTTAATTTSASLPEPSNTFVFGQPATAPEKKSSENCGFKFDSSSGVSSSSTSATPFPFGSESNKKPSAEEKTTKESGFTFSQSSSSFPFGAAKDKTTESSVPLFGNSGPLTTGLNPFVNSAKAPAGTDASKPSTITPAVTTSRMFSFSTATCTTGSTSIFTAPETSRSVMSTSLTPASPFGSPPVSSTQQASKPLFGFTANTGTSKNAEVPNPKPFTFGVSSEPNKSTRPSESKTVFGATSLKRDRDEECDGPSDAKRSFGSTPASGTTAGNFGGFNFATATNSTSAFGGSSVTTTSTTATTTAASSFVAPSFNFAPASSSPATTNTSQPFVFGSNPTPFAGGSASSENTFGNKSSSSSLFDNKSATSKPFGAPPSTANAPFVFGNNSLPFSFSAGSSQGGVYQFSAKQAETPPAAAATTNANIYQFGQTPSTNNAPLGANSSSTGPSTGINFSATPSFNFATGTGGEFTFGSTGESAPSSNTASRRIKKAVRRTKN